MNNLEKEKKKIIDGYQQSYKRVVSYEETLKELISQSWTLNMECFVNKNAECLETYDSLRVDMRYVSRHRKAHEIVCKKDCCYSSVEILKQAIPKSSKVISDLRGAVHCLTQCDEKIILLLQDEIDILKAGISNLQAL